MTQIFSLNAARTRQGKAVQGGGGTAYWPLQALESGGPEQWIHDALAGQPYEGFGLSCWAQQPNLKEATLRLASFITPCWPSEDGSSLLVRAIGEAVKRSEVAVGNGETFTGRFVGVYLYGLTMHAKDVARVSISGVDRFGMVQRWRHFSEPLQAWAVRHGIDTLVAEVSDPLPAEVTIVGIRTHMVVRVSDPIDTGYLMKHAAQG
ncbi:hypothetical protein [Hydrogenophaga sp. ANAO-22]|jgi:hypothetical protein|uniref:hypothetical protein n=1 Tax=Hydrogenophaga sp. ANAO-22 TaxID=3166645 RepID=UPI0036D2E7D6